MLVANAVNSLPGQLVFLRVVRCISLINDKRHIPEINIAMYFRDQVQLIF